MEVAADCIADVKSCSIFSSCLSLSWLESLWVMEGGTWDMIVVSVL